MKEIFDMSKIQRYTSDGCPYEYGGWVEWEDVEALVKKNAALQAKIDELMLEYCPDEMTPEQIAEWERNQVTADIARRMTSD